MRLRRDDAYAFGCAVAACVVAYVTYLDNRSWMRLPFSRTSRTP
jgi:hypothetical protein